MTENPNYYSVIPAEVRYDKRLTANAKLLYAEITALCNMNGCCYATNEYFSKLYKVSKKSISKWISQLCEYGYATSEIVYHEDSKEIFHRYVRIVPYPMEEKFHTPMEEKFHNNITTKVDNNITPTESNIYIQETKNQNEKKSFNISTDKIEKLSDLDDEEEINITSEQNKSLGITYKKKDLLKFLEFWNYYTPVKGKDGRFVAQGSKQACLRKYINLLNEGVKHETIIRNLEQYLRYCQNNGYSSCGAEVYLNQRRFENDYSGIGCVDSKARDIQRGSVNYAKIAAELARESPYDDKDCVPF